MRACARARVRAHSSGPTGAGSGPKSAQFGCLALGARWRARGPLDTALGTLYGDWAPATETHLRRLSAYNDSHHTDGCGCVYMCGVRLFDCEMLLYIYNHATADQCASMIIFLPQ